MPEKIKQTTRFFPEKTKHLKYSNIWQILRIAAQRNIFECKPKILQISLCVQSHKGVKNIFVLWQVLTAVLLHRLLCFHTGLYTVTGRKQCTWKSYDKSKLFIEITAACIDKCEPERLMYSNKSIHSRKLKEQTWTSFTHITLANFWLLRFMAKDCPRASSLILRNAELSVFICLCKNGLLF